MKRNKKILAVCLESNEIKGALLEKTGSGFFVKQLEAISFNGSSPSGSNDENEGDPFGLEQIFQEAVEQNSTDEKPEQQVESLETENKNYIMDLLHRFPIEDCSLALNLAKASVSFNFYESDQNGASLKKMRKEALHNYEEENGREIDSESIQIVSTGNGTVLEMIREGGLKTLDDTLELKPVLGRRLPPVRLLDTEECALLESLGSAIPEEDADVRAVALIEQEHSHIFFMQGRNLLRILPLLNQGYASPNIAGRIYRTILLEQDSGRLPEFKRIILCGDFHYCNIEQDLTEKFGEDKIVKFQDFVHYVKTDQDTNSMLAPFAVPISLAVKALKKPKHRILPSNFLPAKIAEEQKLFKIAWHGLLMLGIIFIIITLLVFQGLERTRQLKILQDTIAEKQTTLDSWLIIKDRLERMLEEIAVYENYYNSTTELQKRVVDWHMVIHDLDKFIRDNRVLWIKQLISTNKGFDIIGLSYNRKAVSKLADDYPDVIIKNVERMNVRDRYLYRFYFEIILPEVVKRPEDMNNDIIRSNVNEDNLPADDNQEPELRLG